MSLSLKTYPIVKIDDRWYSTNSVTVYDDDNSPIYCKPLLLNFPKIKKSVEPIKRTFKVDKVTINLSDFKFENYRISDNLLNNPFSNKDVIIYFAELNSNNTSNFNEVFRGKVQKLVHKKDIISITVEDYSQSLQSIQLPLQRTPDDNTLPDNLKNQPIPILYGEVDNAPCVPTGVNTEATSSLSEGEDYIVSDVKFDTKKSHSIKDSSRVIGDHVLENSGVSVSTGGGYIPLSTSSIEFSSEDSTVSLLVDGSSESVKSAPILREIVSISVSSSNSIAYDFGAAQTTTTFVPPNEEYVEAGGAFNYNSRILNFNESDSNYVLGLQMVQDKVSNTGLLLQGLTTSDASEGGNHESGSKHYYKLHLNEIQEDYVCETFVIWRDKIYTNNFVGIAENINITPSGQDNSQSEEIDGFSYRTLWAGDATVINQSEMNTAHPISTSSFNNYNPSVSGAEIEEWKLSNFSTTNAYQHINWGFFGTYDDGALNIGIGNFLYSHSNSLKECHVYHIAEIDDFSRQNFYINAIGRVHPESHPSPTGEYIKNPITAIYDLFVSELNYTNDDIDLNSLAIAEQAHSNWEFGFSVNENIKAIKLIEDILKSTKCMISFSNEGKLKFITIPTYAYPSDASTIIKRNDILEYSFELTDPKDRYQTISIDYKYDYEFNKYTKKKLGLTASYGYVEPEDGSRLNFESKYINNEETAILLRDFLFYHQGSDSLNATVKLPSTYSNIDIGDIVMFDDLIEDRTAYGINYMKSEFFDGKRTTPLFQVISISIDENVNLKLQQIYAKDWGENIPNINVDGVPTSFSSYYVNIWNDDWDSSHQDIEFNTTNPPNAILGCTDSSALNYNSSANVDDGTCEYPIPDITPPVLDIIGYENFSITTIYLMPDEVYEFTIPNCLISSEEDGISSATFTSVGNYDSLTNPIVSVANIDNLNYVDATNNGIVGVNDKLYFTLDAPASVIGYQVSDLAGNTGYAWIMIDCVAIDVIPPILNFSINGINQENLNNLTHILPQSHSGSSNLNFGIYTYYDFFVDEDFISDPNNFSNENNSMYNFYQNQGLIGQIPSQDIIISSYDYEDNTEAELKLLGFKNKDGGNQYAYSSGGSYGANVKESTIAYFQALELLNYNLSGSEDNWFFQNNSYASLGNESNIGRDGSSNFYCGAYYEDSTGNSVSVFWLVTFEDEILTIGDVNQDGTQNVLDVVQLVNHILGNIELDSTQISSGDLNQDATTDILDVVILVNKILDGDV